ncbi:hypothetical protein MKMG_01881 [Methanogenium sp. MK-MG]|nr:hypothetical protein MKMG_01881 [Methanogenium sp. MK-MG]
MAGIFDNRTDTEKTRHALTPAKKVKIKTALGNKCEKCRKKFPVRNLKVHHIEEAAKASGTKDLNTPGNLLVLCSICHDDVHDKPIPKSTQKGWIKKRSESAKKEIRSILRNRPKVTDGNSSPVKIRVPKISQPKIKPIKIDMPDFFGLGGSNKKK